MSLLTFTGVPTSPIIPATGRGSVFYDPNLKALFLIDDAGTVTPLAGGVAIVSVTDINDPSSELNPLTGTTEGTFLICIQSIINADNPTTLYQWDESPSGTENVPFSVDGSGGRWIAFAGRFVNQIIESSADENKIRFFFSSFAQLPDPGAFHGMFAHVHGTSDPLFGESGYFGHSNAWQMLKDHHNDEEATLTPAASVEVDFGKQSSTYPTLTLDQNTTLTEANAIAGVERLLLVNSGTPGQTLTFPASWNVFGDYDTSGLDNLILVTCTAPTNEENQAGGAPPAKYRATILNKSSGVPAHAPSHELGGSDEVDASGLSGVIENTRTGILRLPAGIISINANPALVDIDVVPIIVIDDTTTPPTVTMLTYPGATGVTVTNLATSPVTTFYLNAAGALVQQSSDSVDGDDRRIGAFIGFAVHQGVSVVDSVDNSGIRAQGHAAEVGDIFQTLGDRVEDGAVYGASGANLLLARTASTFFGPRIGPLTNPSFKDIAADPAIAVYLQTFQDSTPGPFLSTIALAIDPDLWDDGSGTPASVTNNRYTIKRLVFDPRTELDIVELGQNEYTSLANAKDGISANGIVKNAALKRLVLKGWLIIQEGTTDIEAAVAGGDAEFVENTGEIAQSSGFGVDPDAVHVNVAGEIAGVSALTLAAGDFLLAEDISSANAKGRITVQDILDLVPGGTDSLILDEPWVSSNTDTDEIAKYGWKKLTAGTGAELQFIGEANRIGIASMGLGTVAGGRAALYAGGIVNVNPFILDGTQNTLEAEFLVRISTSIGSSDLERVTLGWGDSFELAAGVEHANGVYAEFDPSVSAFWRLRTASASTRSASAGTTTVVVDTMYRIVVRIDYPGGVPTAQLVVNGSDEGSPLTTNIPSVTTGFGQRGDAGSSPGVEVRLDIDRTRITQDPALED